MTNNKSKITLDDGIMRQHSQDKLITQLKQWFAKWFDNQIVTDELSKMIDNLITTINVSVKQTLGSTQGNFQGLKIPLIDNELQQTLKSRKEHLEAELNNQCPNDLVDKLPQAEQEPCVKEFNKITEDTAKAVSILLEHIMYYFNGVVSDPHYEMVGHPGNQDLQPWLIYLSDYEHFHQELLNEIEAGDFDKFNAVITDPPYFINIADWDHELPATGETESKESVFKKYLLSINKLLADDGLIAMFNTKENVALLKDFVTELNQDDRYPDFDYQVMDYVEWVKTNPNHKTDKYYNQRSEYVFVAYRNTLAGRLKHGDWRLNNSVFESATLSKPFNNAGYINQTPKPPRMVIRLLQRLTSRDDTILDSYAGSGSIALAGYSLGRKVYSCEKNQYTQIKATNQFEDYKQSIGQQALRDEPWRDLKEFDVNYDEQELIDATFWSYLKSLATVEQRQSLVNTELISVKNAYRERYANQQVKLKQKTTLKMAKNNAEYAQYQIDRLKPEELGILLGFGQIWHDKDFFKLFGFDNRDLVQAEKIFDPVALNLAIRFRNQYQINRHTNDYPSMLMDFSKALGNAKQANNSDQITSYEHYLLQLMNDLTNFEDEVRNRQNRLTHDDLKPATPKRLSQGIQDYYRLVAILVLVLDAIGSSRENNAGALSEFNVSDDLRAIVFERNRQRGDYHELLVDIMNKRTNKTIEGIPTLLTKDAGNNLKGRGLRMGFEYYRAFLKRHFEGNRQTVIEVPALRPLTVIRTLNIRWKDIERSSMYALQAGFDVSNKHESLATSADDELVRKIYQHDRPGEKKYLKQLIQKQLETTTVANLAKKLMLTQATINNLRK